MWSAQRKADQESVGYHLGSFKSGGHTFPDSRLGDLPKAPRWWVVELGPAGRSGPLAALLESGSLAKALGASPC